MVPREITFKNLAANTRIRVFSANGRLVHELTSVNGENVPWLLNNAQNEIVASGVYYYVIDNGDSHQQVKGKLMIIK